MPRLTCEYCKDTLGMLSNTCSNPLCILKGEPQKGIMRDYKSELV